MVSKIASTVIKKIFYTGLVDNEHFYFLVFMIDNEPDRSIRNPIKKKTLQNKQKNNGNNDP